MGWFGGATCVLCNLCVAYQLGVGALLLGIGLGLRLQPPPFRIRTCVQHSRLRFHLSDLALLANRNRLRSARVHHRSELL